MKKLSNSVKLIIIALLLFGTISMNAQGQKPMTLFGISNKVSSNFPFDYNSNNAGNLGKKAIKQRLDSVDTDRYDSASSTWKTKERTTFQYDNKGNCVLMIDLSLDNSFLELKNRRKTIYAFDGNGNQILNEYHNWNEDNKEWVFGYREEYVFDNLNNKLSQIDYDLNPNSNKVEAVHKTNYIYTNNKLDYSIDSSNFQSSQWTVSNKTTYTLNSNGNIISEITIWWDKVKSSWTNSGKKTYTYDANNNATSTIYYSWDGGTNDWKPTSKTENTYDKDANNVSQIESYWNTTDQIWNNSSKDSNVYNNGDLSQRIAYRWNTILNNWEIEFDATYSYNTAYSKSDLLAPFFFLKFKNHILTGALSQSFEDGVLLYYERGKTYYSSVNTGVNTIKTLPIKIFPNPTNGLLNIDFTTNTKVLNATITDISGKVIKHLNYENSAALQLDISDLSNGIYFLNLQVNDSNTSYKIIKNE